MQELFELGSESTPTLYGLLDMPGNFFYLVYHDRELIARIQHLLIGHKITHVVPLHDCHNWHRNLVDNTVSHRWGIDAFCEADRPQALKFQQLGLVQNSNQPADDAMIVKTNLVTALQFLYELKKRLQYCLSGFSEPLATASLFATDAWVQSALETEIEHYYTYVTVLTNKHDQLADLVCQLDITDPAYANKLNRLAKQTLVLEGFFVTGMMHV